MCTHIHTVNLRKIINKREYVHPQWSTQYPHLGSAVSVGIALTGFPEAVERWTDRLLSPSSLVSRTRKISFFQHVSVSLIPGDIHFLNVSFISNHFKHVHNETMDLTSVSHFLPFSSYSCDPSPSQRSLFPFY